MGWPCTPKEKPGSTAAPRRFGRLRRNPPVQEIGCHWLVVAAHGGDFAPFAGSRLQGVLLHQPDHPLAAHLLVLLDQILVDVLGPVSLLSCLERIPYVHFQAVVTVVLRFPTTL